MRRDRILIVDDEPDTVYLLRFMLERAGFEVLAVGTLEAALRATEAHTPDLVLLDLVLGTENGLSVCRALRDNPRTSGLPIVIVTGKLRTESDTVEGFKAGADDYIMKPFRPAEVVARLTAILERTRRHTDATPLTGLPGNMVIQNQLQRLLLSGRTFGVLYTDLDNFKIYNDVYGFDKGDRVLSGIADGISETVAALCPEAFAGHVGGDHFMVATTPEKLDSVAQGIIGEFEGRIPSWYPPEVVAAGFLTARDRRGHEREHPLMTLSIAGVTNETRTFSGPVEMAAVAAETAKAIKSKAGSNYLKDRRSKRPTAELVVQSAE